jgi:hypothetical protein
MGIVIEPYTTEAQAAAARAFNQRMRDRGQTEFLLGEYPPAAEPENAVVRERSYLAMEHEAVRGGLLLVSFPAGFGSGSEVDVLNCQAPLSEGIIDRKYTFLGVGLLKFMQQQGTRLFALGMGGEQYPFPRLLKSAGWTLAPVPFLFRVVRAGRFLRELRLLRVSRARRIVAGFAAVTGTGKAAISLLQFRGAAGAGGLTIEPVKAWGDWVDELWERCRGDCSFAIRRNLRTVRALYPLDSRTRGYLIREAGRPAGWVAALSTPMRDDKYFGDLRVATLLDSVAIPDAMRGAVVLASRALAKEGVDLLLTNQSHSAWIEAFRAAGYRSASSNYILALSQQLAAEIAAQPGGFKRMHFTRGDGDGRIHL